MIDYESIPMSTYDVICHADMCGNKDITIRILATSNTPYIQCGGETPVGLCNTRITDVTLIQSEEPVDPPQEP